MNYRTATQEDLAILLEFGKQLSLVETRFDKTIVFDEEEARSRYISQLANPLAIFLMAEDEELRPAGYLYAHVDASKLCEVEVVYVDTHYRGRGVAQELVQRCKEWAKSRHATSLSAHIFAQNTASLHAFEKMGFSPHNVEYRLYFG